MIRNFGLVVFVLAAIFLCINEAQVDQSLIQYSTACHGHDVLVTCPMGYSIHVTGAFHGRLDFSTCISGVDESTNITCVAANMVETDISTVCDGLTLCEYTPDWPSLAGNCPGISTYISVRYQCLWPEVNQVSCDSSRLSMTCPGNQVIQVKVIEVGRSANEYCPFVREDVQACTNNNSLAATFIHGVCDGMNRCDVKVAEEVLHTGCDGNTLLVVNITYTCVECVNKHENSSMCDLWAADGQCEVNPWMLLNCLKSCIQCDRLQSCNNTYDDIKCSEFAGEGKCEADPVAAKYCEKSCLYCKNYVLPTPQPTKAPACVNLAKENKCHNFALLGECEVNPYVMFSDCYRSCSGCNATECQNLLSYEECEMLAADGNCTDQAVARQCAGSCNATCNLQDLSPNRKMECVNLFNDDDDCEYWASVGECDTNPLWMRMNCYKACTKCHRPDICDDVDDHRNCTYWAAKGNCTNLEFTHRCPHSCGRCPEKNITDTAVTECVNEHASNGDCSYWALQGECNVNPAWMTKNCYKACKQCETTNVSACVNEREDKSCEFWKSNDECESNSLWMSLYCYKTCSFCDLPECANRRPDDKCVHWASIGQCEMNKEWMYINCRKACFQCEEHLNTTTLCQALYNATRQNETEANMTTARPPTTTVRTTTIKMLSTTPSNHTESNMTECEKGAASGNCTDEEFALFCPEECYNITCKENNPVYKHPVMRYYDVPQTKYGSANCKGEVNVYCPSSYNINITNIAYEPVDKKFCNATKKKQNVCKNAPLMDEMKAMCDDRSWCFFNLSDTSHSNFTEDCPADSSRFLNVSYTCTEPHFTGQVCEKGVMRMRCWSFQAIQIHRVFYGREDDYTCAVDGKVNTVLHNGTCQNPYAKELVSELCNYNQTCGVEASPILFGDPCPGTSKYLEVEFSCIECRNQYRSDFHCDYWAQIGECEKNKEWMMAYCRKSCTRCNIVDTCTNNHTSNHDCNTWATMGECKRNPEWMIKHCRRSCNRCPDIYKLPEPTTWPKIEWPGVYKNKTYSAFYHYIYLTRNWNEDFKDRMYPSTKEIIQITNDTLWAFYEDVYPEIFQSVSLYHFKKSVITPWTVVGFYLTLNENVTEYEAVNIDCAIFDGHKSLVVDNDTLLIPVNQTKRDCKHRHGYCKYGATLLRREDGVYYCKCTGHWKGSQCNRPPWYGLLIIIVVGLAIVIIPIVLCVRKRWRSVKDDKTELVTVENAENAFPVELEMPYLPTEDQQPSTDPADIPVPVTPDLISSRKFRVPKLSFQRSQSASDNDKQTLQLEEEEIGVSRL